MPGWQPPAQMDGAFHDSDVTPLGFTNTVIGWKWPKTSYNENWTQQIPGLDWTEF